MYVFITHLIEHVSYLILNIKNLVVNRVFFNMYTKKSQKRNDRIEYVEVWLKTSSDEGRNNLF